VRPAAYGRLTREREWPRRVRGGSVQLKLWVGRGNLPRLRVAVRGDGESFGGGPVIG